MSVDAIGLDARDHLIEDEDYEPELLQSDEKLWDDEVDQIAGLLLDEGPEVTVGDKGVSCTVRGCPLRFVAASESLGTKCAQVDRLR